MLSRQKLIKTIRPHKNLRQQQGIVIVVALFIVAIVATMAYFMMSRLARDTERTSLLLRYTQAEYYAQGSIAWAMDQLRNNWEKKRPNQIIDALPLTSPRDKYQGYIIISTIHDMQARFNLNNLRNPQTQTDFIRLVQTVAPTLPSNQAQVFTQAIANWVNPASEPTENNKTYFSLSPPYRAAQRPMLSPSELPLVKGITPDLYLTLAPYITALPPPTAINVRTAPLPVLMSLGPNISKEIAQTIVATRNHSPYDAIIKNYQLPVDKITEISRYFLVETTVTIEKQQTVIYTLLERTATGNKAELKKLWTSKGVW